MHRCKGIAFHEERVAHVRYEQACRPDICGDTSFDKAQYLHRAATVVIM